MTYLVAALATFGTIAIGAVLLAAVDKYLPEPKDGLHRPRFLPQRTVGRLVAWSGAVKRA